MGRHWSSRRGVLLLSVWSGGGGCSKPRRGLPHPRSENPRLAGRQLAAKVRLYRLPLPPPLPPRATSTARISSNFLLWLADARRNGQQIAATAGDPGAGGEKQPPVARRASRAGPGPGLEALSSECARFYPDPGGGLLRTRKRDDALFRHTSQRAARSVRRQCFEFFVQRFRQEYWER